MTTLTMPRLQVQSGRPDARHGRVGVRLGARAVACPVSLTAEGTWRSAADVSYERPNSSPATFRNGTIA